MESHLGDFFLIITWLCIITNSWFDNLLLMFQLKNTFIIWIVITGKRIQNSNCSLLILIISFIGITIQVFVHTAHYSPLKLQTVLTFHTLPSICIFSIMLSIICRVLARRTYWTIKSVFSWSHFFYSHGHLFWFKGGIMKRNKNAKCHL